MWLTAGTEGRSLKGVSSAHKQGGKIVGGGKADDINPPMAPPPHTHSNCSHLYPISPHQKVGKGLQTHGLTVSSPVCVCVCVICGRQAPPISCLPRPHHTYWLPRRLLLPSSAIPTQSCHVRMHVLTDWNLLDDVTVGRSFVRSSLYIW